MRRQALKSSLPSWEHMCRLHGKTHDFCKQNWKKIWIFVVWFTKIMKGNRPQIGEKLQIWVFSHYLRCWFGAIRLCLCFFFMVSHFKATAIVKIHSKHAKNENNRGEMVGQKNWRTWIIHIPVQALEMKNKAMQW